MARFAAHGDDASRMRDLNGSFTGGEKDTRAADVCRNFAGCAVVRRGVRTVLFSSFGVHVVVSRGLLFSLSSNKVVDRSGNLGTTAVCAMVTTLGPLQCFFTSETFASSLFPSWFAAGHEGETGGEIITWGSWAAWERRDFVVKDMFCFAAGHGETGGEIITWGSWADWGSDFVVDMFFLHTDVLYIQLCQNEKDEQRQRNLLHDSVPSK